jgi:FMN phosphatase YigB (HAD superfamily)
MIKAILFDFIETLGSAADGYRAAEKTAQKRIYGQLGLEDWDGFLEIYRQVRRRFHGDSCFSRLALWRQVHRELGREADDRLLARWEDEYWSTVERSMTLFPETLVVLGRLMTLYRLGLVTNQGSRGSTRGLSFPVFGAVAPYFEVVVVGGEGGIRPKPAPDAFREALRRLEVRPAEAVYVGDDWEADIRGARQAGIRPIWIRHHSVRRNWPEGGPGVPVITRLDELSGVEALAGEPAPPRG